ncbi:hypothetical protein ACPPVV_17700 [Rhodanobacter sp. Col0626]|uniref:hypothetical protein n=1 Tax=Rhodanobacter sp. Col0626 TaxID=3415679 RepID=UPI003CF65029
MSRVFLILHALGALTVFAICLVAASESVSYYGAEPFAFTYSRSAAALLCGSFAATHLYLLASRRLTFSAALFFYPLCLLLGLATELIARSGAKGWAPSSTTDAVWANIIGYSVLAALVAICALSCYRSFARGRHANA